MSRILLLLLLAAFLAVVPAWAAPSPLPSSTPCSFKFADGSVLAPPPQGYVCDYIATNSPGPLAKFSSLSLKDQRSFVKENSKKAAAAYAAYQRQRDALLNQTRPDAGPASASSLAKLKNSLALLEQRGDAVTADFAANRGAYVREFAQRENELNLAIQKQEKGLGLKQRAELSRANSKFQREASGAAGELKGAAGSLAQGESAQTANGKLFDNSAGSSLQASGSADAGPSPQLRGTAAQQVGSASTMYGKVDSVNPAAPGAAPSKSWTDSTRSFLHGQADDAEQAGADHLAEADKPGTPWYKRWYHETAAAGDAVRESVAEVGAGDSKPWTQAGHYWSQKGAAMNADADSLDENGWSGAKKFAEKGAAMGMLVTGHVTGNMPEYAQKTEDFSGRLADGDGEAWKETGSAVAHAPVALVTGVYDSGKGAVVAWKQFGQMDSHTTTYNGLVATAKSVGFLGMFAVPAEGAAGTVAAKEGAEEVAVAAGKEAAEQTAATAAKETAASATAAEGRSAGETLLKDATEKEAATAGKDTAVKTADATAKDVSIEEPAKEAPSKAVASGSKEAAHSAPNTSAEADAEAAARAQARAAVVRNHMDAYGDYVRSMGSEPEELSPVSRKMFLDGYLQKEQISADSPLAQEMDRTLALQEVRPPKPYVPQFEVVGNKAPPPWPGPRQDAVGYIDQEMDRLSTPQALAQTAKDPKAFKSFADTVLRPKQTPEISELREAWANHDTAGVAAGQKNFQNKLLDGAQQLIKENGLNPNEIIAHGTGSEGMLGMMRDGVIRSNVPHPGFSGEGSNVYAGGMEQAAQYATRGPAKGQAAVLVLMRKTPDLNLSGGILNQEPTLSQHFVGFVVTDGEKTTVITQEQAISLNRSYKTWTDGLDEGLRSGRSNAWQDYNEWLKYDTRLTPRPTD